MTLLSIFDDLAVEIVAAVLIAVACFVGPVVWFYLTEYRLLLKFFGITAQKRKIILYLSSLNVVPGGAVDAKGTPRSYSGLALPGYEYMLIPPFAMLFGSLRERAFYGIARIAGSRFWPFRVEMQVSASPLNPHDIDFENIVTIGSAGYNEVTAHYHRTGGPYLSLDTSVPSPVIRILKGAQAGTTIPNPNNSDLAILERLHDPSHGTVVFVAAGLGINGSRGAAEYLFSNWRVLQKTYDDENFAWCLSFPFAAHAPNGWRNPTVLQRFPH